MTSPVILRFGVRPIEAHAMPSARPGRTALTLRWRPGHQPRCTRCCPVCTGSDWPDGGGCVVSVPARPDDPSGAGAYIDPCEAVERIDQEHGR
jgi:hypothetical protein